MSFKKILAVVVACVMAFGAFAASALTLDVAEAADEKVAVETADLAATTIINEAALRAAMAEGGEIVLGADIEFDSALYVEAEDDVTIDFNGHTLKYTETSGCAIISYGNLTLKDTSAIPGGLESTTTQTYALWALSGNLTISDIYVLGSNGGLYLDGSSNTVINSGKFDATGLPGITGHTVFVTGSASVVIHDGIFGSVNQVRDSGCTVVTYSNGANVVIYGGTFAKNIGYNIDIWNGGNVTIFGGSFEPVNSSNKGYPSNAIPDSVTVTTDANGNSVFTNDETKTVEAIIGTKTYSTIAEAISVATTGNTIKIMEGTYSASAFVLPATGDVYADNLNIVGVGDVTLVLADDDISYIHPSANQYYVGGNRSKALEKITFRNINFKLNVSDSSSRVDELYIFSKAVTFTGCSFDDIAISPSGTGRAAINHTTFKNITNRSAIHYSNSEDLSVTGCTFETGSSGIHLSADVLKSLSVTNNTFINIAEDSAAIYFGNESWNAGWTGDYSAATLTVTGNVAEGALIRNINPSLTLTQLKTLSDETANTFETALTENSTKFVATIDGVKGYTTLDAAIADVKDGDTVTVFNNVTTDSFTVDGTIPAEDAVLAADGKTFVVDLNGYTWYLKDVNSNGTTRINHKNGANVTYKNGTINVSEAVDSVNFFSTGVYDKTAATMTFENVTVVGDGYNSGYAVFYLCSNSDSVLNIINSTINLANEKGSAGGVIKADNQDSKVNITGTTMVLDNVQRGIVSATTTIDNSTIEFKNLKKTALRNLNGTINNSTITVAGAEYGIENDATSALAINVTGNSFVKLLGAAEYDLSLAVGSTALTIEEGSVLYADTSDIADASTVTGNAVILANVVEVVFEKVDGEAEGYDLYNINLVGVNGETINRLNSADLTFKFVATAVTGGAMDYEILPVKNVTLTPDTTTPNEHRYMFNFNGKDVAVIGGKDTANVITLAQVKVSGYGTYTFSVDTSDEANKTNTAHATTISDNIVDTFVPGGATGKGELKLDESTTGVVEIVVPVRTLTVNVAFPNSVVDNDVLYQDMKVEITGNIEGVHQTVTYKLGGDMQIDGTYVVTDARLVLNEAYNVVVSGAGYRTARYTVTMTEGKTLNFWNNVKDNAVEVEEGKAASAVTKNFLAGDIVGDNQINIYDLSAVVSYFATDATTDYDRYVKYDLNRDGMIDSKDVAYVLVSWGA